MDSHQVDKIKNVLEELNNVEIERRNRIANWLSNSREQVRKILSEIVNEIKYDWHLNVGTAFNDDSSPIIQFGHTPISKDNNGKLVIKSGGSLGFYMRYDGKVGAVITYPSIKGGDRVKGEPIKIIDPNIIDENVVVDCVVTFIAKMILWEKDLINI